MGAVITAKETPAAARAGTVRFFHGKAISSLASHDVKAGVFQCNLAGGTRECKSPTTAAEVDDVLGVTIYDPIRTYNDTVNEFLDGDPLDLLPQGEIYALGETAMLEGADVYVRFDVTTTEVRGSVRNNSDGGDVVTFVVNSAVNSETVSVSFDGLTFSVLGDVSALTTEIATLLAAKIDAHADYTAPAPGASTFVVTRVSGAPIELGSVSSTITATSGAKAKRLAGARVAADASGAGPVAISLVLP